MKATSTNMVINQSAREINSSIVSLKSDQLEARDIVCPCSGTTKEKIRTLIATGRADTVEDISRITGACSGCGACEPEVLDLLTQYKQL